MDRPLPVAVFRCSESLDQAQVQLTYYKREEGLPDVLRPKPRCVRVGCPRKGLHMDVVVQLDETVVDA